MAEVPRRGIRPDGWSTCVRAMSDDVDCGEPATWHIWWVGDDITSSACDEHYAESVAKDWEMKDAHRFGGVCLIPGTHWQFTAQGEEGFCFLPIDLDEPAVMTVSIPKLIRQEVTS